MDLEGVKTYSKYPIKQHALMKEIKRTSQLINDMHKSHWTQTQVTGGEDRYLLSLLLSVTLWQVPVNQETTHGQLIKYISIG